MNPQQKATGIGCVVVSLLVALAVIAALITEGHAVVVGGHSTISELARWVWALQPWVIWLVSVVIAFIAGFFSGHFFAAPVAEYDRIRREGL